MIKKVNIFYFIALFAALLSFKLFISCSKDTKTSSKEDQLKLPITVSEAKLSQISKPKPNRTYWNAPGNVIFNKEKGLTVDLEAVYKKANIEISLDNNDDYQVKYMLNNEENGTQVFPNQKKLRMGGLFNHQGKVPESAVSKGYNKLILSPLKGDRFYSVGHIRLY